MNLDDLATQLHYTAVEKGFWKEDIDADFILSKLALVHSEVSEVLEAVRKQKGSQIIVEEMADIIIRLLDLYDGMFECGWVNHSLDETLAAKAAFNRTRPYKHGVLA